MVANNIKVFRTASKLTQADFALRIGVTQETVSNWENSKTKPDIDQVLTMVDMGANIEYLLFGRGTPIMRMSA